MLAASQRLRSAAEFRTVFTGGARSGRATVVVYVRQTGNATSMAGFAVSKAVGGAVVRNTVRRRLRAIVSELLAEWGDGYQVVVRALPAAATASFGDLRTDVRAAGTSAHTKVAT